MRPSRYRIRLPEFEGPLDVLLFFVQREELPIEAIPIARLVEQFMSYLRWAEAVDLELAAEFFDIAAELLLIKARWLLHRPVEEGHEEREPTLGETSEPLWERLAEYRRYKLAAASLRQRLAEGSPLYIRSAPLPWKRGTDGDWENATPEALREALRGLIHQLGRVVAPLPVREELAVAEYALLLVQQVQHAGQVSFAAVVRGRSRTEIVVFFLALLELGQRGQVEIQQEEPFGDILLMAEVPQLQETADGGS